MNKKRGHDLVKSQLEQDLMRKENAAREEAQKTEAARSQIRNAIKTSKEKVDIYYSTKNAGVIQERQIRIRKEKDMIYELEREAQSLESAEDDLIKRL